MNKTVAINKEGNFCILTPLYEGSLSQYTSLEYQHGYADVVKEQLEILSDL